MRRYIPVVILLIVLAVLAWPSVTWHFKDDRERIEYALASIADAAERRHARDILNWVSEDYQGDRFHNDRDDLMNTLRRFVFTFKAVKVTLSEIDIAFDETNPDRATVRLTAEVLVTKTPNTEPTTPFLRNHRGTDGFVLIFTRENGVWRVLEAKRPQDMPDADE